jgi:hypothetical protein
MEAQSYSDRFPRHHIMFSYRLPYLLNNTKMIEKYEKIEPEFPEILLTVFILRCVCLRGVQSMGGPSGKWAKSGYTVYEVEIESRSVFGLFPDLWPMGLASWD